MVSTEVLKVSILLPGFLGKVKKNPLSDVVILYAHVFGHLTPLLLLPIRYVCALLENQQEWCTKKCTSFDRVMLVDNAIAR